MTRAEALAILESGDFEQLVGRPETLEVEFKGEPYQLDRESQKFELAKDVSAMANAAGGVIVIGAHTQRDSEVAVDVVSTIRPLSRGLVSEQQYETIISDRVYPRLREVHVRFWPAADVAERGLVAIDVPPQDDLDKYFLVQRPAEEGTDRTPGWLVGLVIRSVGRVEPRRIGELHSVINRGLAVGQRLSDLSEAVAEIRERMHGAGASPLETPADRLFSVLETRLGEIGETMSEPLYSLAAAPSDSVEVPTLTREQGVRQFLEHPPHGRYEGWNLVTLERAELRPGPRLHIQNGERKFIDLQADGTFTAIGAFDGFLGHGRWDFSEQPKANGLAVVEFTHEFVTVYERLLHEYIEPVPTQVRFGVGVRNAYFRQGEDERKLLLTPGPVTEWSFGDSERKEAVQPALDASVDVTTSPEEPHLDVGAVTYELVRHFYNSFGHTDDAVPYTNEAHDAIDIEKIRRD